MKFYRLLFLLIGFSAALFSCNEDEEITPSQEPHVEVNNWIFDTMNEVYLWSEFIPQNADVSKNSEDFFDDLLYYQDRFSIIYPDYAELENLLNGVTKEAGYEYMLSKVSGTTEDVIAIILYVKNNSPAQEAGLMRGDLITHINGTKFSTSNYRDLIAETQSAHEITFKRYNESSAAYEVQPKELLETVVLSENPIYLSNVITTNSGKKVGYLVYNFFSAGSNGSDQYDQELVQKFTEFKAEGVNEFVLDLRYNGGGSLSTAVLLGSLLGKNVDETKIFSENRWNDLYQEYIEGLEDGDAILRRRFLSVPENIGNQLLDDRLYVLTGSRTASASELIINGLRPYMEVFLIGDQTVGKNVGSVLLNDEENPENSYGILPIVFQVYNSLGQSDYGEGFIPDATVEDFTFPMAQLGDEDEPLLSYALALIEGTTTGRAYKDKGVEKTLEVQPIMSSLDNKAYSNKILFDSK